MKICLLPSSEGLAKAWFGRRFGMLLYVGSVAYVHIRVWLGYLGYLVWLSVSKGQFRGWNLI